MSSVPSQGKTRGIRTRSRAEARRDAARRLALRSMGLEALEVRELLSTVPTTVFNTSPTTVGSPGSTGNLSTPSIAVDPNNVNKLVAVWTDFDPTFAPGPTEVVRAAYSNNGGTSWVGLNVGGAIIDPTSSATGPTVLPFQTDASVQFDKNDNAYILYSQHNAGNTSGALLLSKYNFAGNTPSTTFTNNRVYEWINDGAVSPQLAVDSSVATFSDTNSNGVTQTQNDPNSGNVYVVFQSLDVAPAAVTNLTNYDANRIKILASSDGGVTFSGIKQVSNPITTTVSTGVGGTVSQPVQLQANNNGSQREVTPVVTVSQGTATSTGSTARVAPGLVTVAWDTYQTQNLPTPPVDTIFSDPVAGGAYAVTADSGATTRNPIPLPTGIAGANGAPDTPVSTSITLSVNINSSRFVSLSDLNLALGIQDANLNTLSAVLVPPPNSGFQSVTLFQNQTNSAGTTNAAVGISGANLGIAPDGEAIGTTFDDGATRDIVDFNTTGGRGAAAPFVGHFQTELGSLNRAFAGANANPSGPMGVGSLGSVNGNWTLVITDFRSSTPNPPNGVVLAKLILTSGLTPGTNKTVASTFAQAAASGRALVTPADPFGVTPQPQLASDNTLGSYSPNQGRIYLAYVDKLTPLTNDANNFDIFMAYSDDGGQTWNNRVQTSPSGSVSLLEPVNDDQATTDGYSGSSSNSVGGAYGDSTTVPLHGRVQFMPSIAVDQSTGAVGLSWYDARNDASDARVAMYTTTSIDGGITFSPDQYANASQTATDAITLSTVNLGPVPDNQSSGDSARDTTFSYGTHQGLAFLDGKLIPIWSGNQNVGGGPINPPPNLSILTNVGRTTAGPRVIGVTQGPVGLQGDTVNNQRAADGGPTASAFQVSFDRPIDPSTFGVGDVVIMYRDTNAADTTGTVIPAQSVVPLNATAFGATLFQINFAPQSAVGTYSLEVTAADIRDRIRSYQDNASGSLVLRTGNLLDQNGNGTGGQATDYFATPSPVNHVAGGAFVGPFVATSLPLIVPGPHVASTSVPGQPLTSDNLVLNGSTSSIDVVFDRDMNPASFTAASVLSLTGPLGAISGPFTITPNPNGSDPDPNHPRTYRIGFPTQSTSGTYTLTLASSITDSHGNALDTNLNAGLDVLRGTVSGPTTAVTYNATGLPLPTDPTTLSVSSTLSVPDQFLVNSLTVTLNVTTAHDPNIKITLTSPTGDVIPLVPYGTGATGTQANFQNTIFDDSATTLIQNGGPPFFGRFKPQQPLSGFNGEQASGSWTLTVTSNSSTVAATLNSWSLTFQKSQPGTGLGETVADQATVGFRVFNLSPTDKGSSTTWTGVGPATTVGPDDGDYNGFSGQIGAIAVDPSDPSGNTVYVAGATGGIWKTTNFLTTSANGPTYVPLTDFGPTFGVNIGSIAVFARNGDPRQSIIIAGTGDGDDTYGYNSIGSRGIGFLISTNGGSTWSLLDSTNNNLPYAQRDHIFAANGGTSTMQVVVDPHPTVDGQVIIYAAMKGAAGGLWRSVDTGQTWQQLSNPSVQGTEADSIVLDYNSATVNAVSNPTGNVNTIYVAFPTGVYISPNRGGVLNLMAGGGVDPLIVDTTNGRDQQVTLGNAPAPTGGAGDRIIIAKPSVLSSTASRASVENTLYESWLYAVVVNSDGSLQGAYITKDNGTTWTQIKIPTLSSGNSSGLPLQIIPTNDYTQPNYDPLTTPIFQHGEYDVSLTVDPNNPQVFYIGGTANGQQSGLIRVDVSQIYDSHAVVPFANNRNDGGTVFYNSSGRTPVFDINQNPYSTVLDGQFGTAIGSYLNVEQDPNNPFQVNATTYVFNVASFTNDGSGVTYIPIDEMLKESASASVPTSNVHQIVAMVDPLTGQTRLVVGDDEGVFTGLLTSTGQLSPGVGNAVAANYSRNGNLELAQLLYGASQPSTTLLNSQIASSLFYGNGNGVGLTGSNPDILTTGQINGNGSTSGSSQGIPAITSADQEGTGVGVDQQGNNVVYRYYAPASGGNGTNFFQVSTSNGAFISRTTGLVQVANDPQWPGESPTYGNGLTFGNFTVNPLNGSQVLISSAAGRIFSTINAGQQWLSIGEPGSLDGTYAPALTYGAPDPSAPGGIGNLNNFIYAGTVGGHIFVTTIGGGASFNAWTNISNGLDGSPVVDIVTDPTRGSHDAYAVTFNGVYYMADSTAASPTWVNITGAIFSQMNLGYNASTPAQMTAFLTSIQADWRYVIPNANGSGTHPILYVSGNAGVYRSLDNGATWTPFPSQSVDGAAQDFGYLPNVDVDDLTIVNGKIDPTTGRAVAVAGDPNVLLATTYGRGQFAIELSPTIFPSSVALDTTLPLPSGSVSGTDPDGTPIVNVPQPVIDGLSEQSAFGNTVFITLYDLTDPANPRYIGGYNPADASTKVAANETNAAGQFQIQVNAMAFTTNGIKTVGVQATDASGSQGNTVTLKFDLTAKLPTNQAPAAPTLQVLAADDSSGGDGTETPVVTNVVSPHLTGTTDPGVTVLLYASSNGSPTGSPVAQTTSDANGDFTFQFFNFTDGTFSYQAVAQNAFGSTVGTKVVTLKIVTTRPTQTPTLTLSPASDTGIPGDNITADHTPTFVGTTIPNAQVRLYRSVNGSPDTTVLATTHADANGNFSIMLPQALSNGPISLQVQISDQAGNVGTSPSLPLTVTIVTVLGDYLGNGKTTPAVFIRNGNGGMVFQIQGVNPASGVPYGSATTDIPFQGDFDGDGITDLAVYRPSTNTWFEKRSSLGSTSFTLGTSGTIPFVADFDGDGVTDVGAYNPKTGVFTIAESTLGIVTKTMPTGSTFTPQANDIPVPGNYDGTGVVPAVYRPGTGQFFIDSTNGLRVVTLSTGTAGDVPVPGNYDNSTSYNKFEPAVFNPTTGVYLIAGPTANRSYQFLPGDIPSPGDYDGVGYTEAAVYRQSPASPGVPSFVVRPNNAAKEMIPYGTGNGTPVGAPYVYRNIAQPGTSPGDYLGTGKTQPAFYRRNSQTGGGYWYVLNDAAINGKPFGSSSLDIPLTGDFDGDGKTDLALYRPSTAQWYVSDSSTNYTNTLLTTFGQVGVDIPVPGDYLGTGKTGVAVYRPTTGQFFIQGLPGGFLTPVVSQPGDVPVPGNYDNTGKTEAAVFRPSTGTWYIIGPAGLRTITAFGSTGDIPVPGRYDASAANQSVEPAVWQPNSGRFIVHGPNGNRVYQFAVGDIPAPGDYDGIGKDEPAVFRPSTGQWLVFGPNDSSPRVVATSFGSNSGKDIPVLSPYFYRALPGSSGGISAASFAVGATISSGGGSLDLGSSARSLSSGSVSAPSGLTPTAASAPVSINFGSTARVRPLQEAASSQPKHPFLELQKARLAARHAARLEAAQLAKFHRPLG